MNASILEYDYMKNFKPQRKLILEEMQSGEIRSKLIQANMSNEEQLQTNYISNPFASSNRKGKKAITDDC